jgi:hypothetical protein
MGLQPPFQKYLPAIGKGKIAKRFRYGIEIDATAHRQSDQQEPLMRRADATAQVKATSRSL